MPAASHSSRAWASVGASAITRTTGSVLLPRTCSHQSEPSSRRPSSRLTRAPGHRSSNAASASGSFSRDTSYFVLSIAYRGSPATSSLNGRRSCAISDRMYAIPTNGSRTQPTRGSITPPLPSPPITAPTSRIRATTFASPTADRTHSHPSSRAASSTIRDVDMLIATGPRCSRSRYFTARASVASSLTHVPVSSIRASRSESGSSTNPTAEPVCLTHGATSARCAGIGSGSWRNLPVGSHSCSTTSHPRSRNSFAPSGPPAPALASRNTRNPPPATASTLTWSRTAWVCSVSTSGGTRVVPTPSHAARGKSPLS